MTVHMLSTIDNPYNPFKEFEEWLSFDERMGYETTGLLARLVKSSDDISEADQELEIENTIDEIVRLNVLGIYIKVAEPGESG